MLLRCSNAVLAALVAVLWLAAAALAQSQLSPRDLAVIRINAIDLLANEPRLPLPIKQRRDVLRTYYEEMSGDLFWLSGNNATALLTRLGDAEADGLRSSDYPVPQLAKLAAAAPETDARGRAIVELYFAAAFLEYASDIRVGRFLPAKVDPNFFIQERTIDPLEALTALAAAGNVDAFFLSWQPQNPNYAQLRLALRDYRTLAAAGGWGRVPLGETLKPDMTDPRVPSIRARLAITDGATMPPPDADPELYAGDIVDAVMRFQARHGLDVDGVIGPATLVAMNVSVEDRIASLDVAMERLRWMPEDLGAQYLIVNIAGFELRRFAGGEERERMAVVVGKPYSRTPVFSDLVRYLEFNPYWTMPSSILLKEELPKLQANAGAIAAQGFEAMRGSEAYDVASIDWNSYGRGNMPFMLRQRPGPNNALGRVKFMFPNSHDVYLHDTPSRSLFGESERAFSHGCVRVSRPLDLAVQVLAAGGVGGWDLARIDSVVASQKNTVVNLAEPLPVHITYLTSWVDAQSVNFRKDIYEHDAKLLAALDGKRIAW